MRRKAEFGAVLIYAGKSGAFGYCCRHPDGRRWIRDRRQVPCGISRDPGSPLRCGRDDVHWEQGFLFRRHRERMRVLVGMRVLMHMFLGMDMRDRALQRAGAAAGAQRLVDDAANGARAAPALRAAAKAAIDLAGGAHARIRVRDRVAHLTIRQHIARTDDHRDAEPKVISSLELL